MNIYQEQILEHYHHPHNAAKLATFTHSFKLENLTCGDSITIYLNVVDQIVTEVGFEAEGCAISIASASLLSDALKGKSVQEINYLEPKTVTEMLGIELTPSRIKCALLPLDAAKAALHNSRGS